MFCICMETPHSITQKRSEQCIHQYPWWWMFPAYEEEWRVLHTVYLLMYILPLNRERTPKPRVWLYVEWQSVVKCQWGWSLRKWPLLLYNTAPVYHQQAHFPFSHRQCQLVWYIRHRNTKTIIQIYACLHYTRTFRYRFSVFHWPDVLSWVPLSDSVRQELTQSV